MPSTGPSSTNSAPTAAKSAASSRAPTCCCCTRPAPSPASHGCPPLAYFDIDGKLIVIGSFAGAPVSPAWVHNLRANPSARVEVGTDAFDVTARELPTDERDDLFDKVTAAAPGFAEYQAKTSRVIPLFELIRT